MKTIEVLYGRRSVSFEIPEENLIQVIELHSRPAADTGETLLKALRHPIGSPTLRELTRNIRKILLITSDNTRPMPSRATIPVILSQLYRAADEYEITILIATGLHREMTREEIEERFSPELARRYPIVNHVAEDESNLISLGTMSTGNELWVNRRLKENELIIAEGFIEPHFFAGFSGGRKSILPGVCGRETILYNHRPQNIASPFAAMGSLERNPIHRECMEAARMAGLQFILNVTLDREKQITAAFAGDPVKAHLAGCRFARQAVEVPVRPADIVVASNNGFPLDRNIYQAVKGMTAAARAAKDNGVIVLAAECADKNGNNQFARLIQSCDTKEELYRKMSEGASENDKWQAQIFADIVRHHPVILMSDQMETSEVEKMFMLHARTPAQAMEKAFRLAGEHAAVSVIPEGPVIMPVPQNPAGTP